MTPAGRVPTTPGSVRLCLAGDVMVGRGIDQIQRHPGDPTIHEPWVRSALRYVELAESRSGPIPREVGPEYIWGDALAVLGDPETTAVIVNLETAVTAVGSPWPGKGIQYRMHPDNVSCLTSAGIDVAVLANNHVLDWSTPGLEQTLDGLHSAGIRTAGAGRTAGEAWAPAVVDAAGRSRVLVFAAGSLSSGIPRAWAATERTPGVALLTDLSDATVERIAAEIDAAARPGDVVVMSLHWGHNWGYRVSRERRRFAHQLIDIAGVHVVHGHSSHHPVGIEVHDGHPILYGCGDLISDYEGIDGYEQYRGEIRVVYRPTIDAASGRLLTLELVPFRVDRFRLANPTEEDTRWLAETLTEQGARWGATVLPVDEATLAVAW